MKQDFCNKNSASITDLINQIEYDALKTNAEKADYAYKLGFEAGLKEAQKRYEPVVEKAAKFEEHD